MKRNLVVTVLLLSMSLCGCSRSASYEEAAANMTVATEYVVTDEQEEQEVAEEAQEEEQKLCQVVFNSDSITRSDLATSGVLERYSWYRSQGYTEDDKCNPSLIIDSLLDYFNNYSAEELLGLLSKIETKQKYHYEYKSSGYSKIELAALIVMADLKVDDAFTKKMEELLGRDDAGFTWGSAYDLYLALNKW